MELVSIVVPVYKVEKYLDKCIGSIRRQTYPDLEIILVDDGSPDRCKKMCDEYAAEDERIQVIHKENGGLGDARNAGIQRISGEYLLFVDSDDWIHEELVERTVETAQKYEADIVLFDYVSVEENGNQGNVFSMGIPSGCVLSTKDEPRLIMASCSAVNKLYRREFWEKTGLSFTKGRYYEDLGTIPKMMGLAERIVYRKEVLYYYLSRGGSIMHSVDFRKNYEDRTAAVDGVLRFYREHKLLEQYQKELEYLVFENIYFVPSKEIVLNDRKSPYLSKFRAYAYKRFPNLERNLYIKEMPCKDRILWLLLKKKMYVAMVSLSYARRAKDRLTGRFWREKHGISQRGRSSL